jgi:hypothetical protein
MSALRQNLFAIGGIKMMRFVGIFLTALVAASLVLGLPGEGRAQQDLIVAQTKKTRAAATPRNAGTHVYLLRGFMDIFSTGMDDLGVKLNRSGIRASVHGHGDYPTIADAIIERHRQGVRENVVIIGHSLGANACFEMAQHLGRAGITVPLIIAFDPTSPMTVGSNVTRVVNFYSSTNGWGSPIVRGVGFRGTLNNVDLSRRGEIGHTDIDKSPALHAQSIGFIRSIGSGSSASATVSPDLDEKPRNDAAKPETNATKKDTAPASNASVPASSTLSPSTTAAAAAAAEKSATAPSSDNKN